MITKKGTVPLNNNIVDDYFKNKKEFKLGFTNGCFDLIQSGHIYLFKKAKEMCDYLIVGINSDSSIKQLKGKSRPILDEKVRFDLISSIKYVDEVRIFSELNPLKLIKEINPDLLVKGEDYLEKEIIGADYVKNYSCKVYRVKLQKRTKYKFNY